MRTARGPKENDRYGQIVSGVFQVGGRLVAGTSLV